MLEQLQASDAKVQAAVVETVGGQAPEAQIDSTSSQVVQAALSRAIGNLTGGDVKLPIVEQQPGRLAPGAFTGLMAFETMIDGLLAAGVEEAREYKIDAKDAASDPEKLIAAAQVINAAGKDKALQTAVRRNPAAGKPKAAEKPAVPAKVEPAAPPESQAKQLTRAMMAQPK